MIVFAIFGYILLCIGLFLTVIIVVPYNYEISGDNLAQPKLTGSVSWLFGDLKISFYYHSQQDRQIILTILGFKKQVKIRPISTKANPKKNLKHTKNIKNLKSKQSRKYSDFLKYIKRDIAGSVISSLVKILKHCLPKALSVNTRIGFNDPFYTGLLSAFLGQFDLSYYKYDINIEPVFDEEIIEGRFLIGGQIWLPYLILVMIGFLIAKPIRNMLISRLKTKIKGGFQYVR